MKSRYSPEIRKLLERADEMMEYTSRNLEDLRYFCDKVRDELKEARAKRAEKYFSLN